MDLKPGDRVRHIPIHADAPPSGDTGVLTRRAPDGTTGGDWLVIWDHDPEQKERLTRSSLVEQVESALARERIAFAPERCAWCGGKLPDGGIRDASGRFYCSRQCREQR